MEPEFFEDLRREQPSAKRVAMIQDEINAVRRPVRALASNAILTAGCTLVFILLAIAGAALVGFSGFRALSFTQMMIEYSALLASAVFLSACVVALMIPGARFRVPALLAVLVPLVLLSLLVPFLFPDFTTNEYVRLGVPCLRLGTLCAVAGGVVSWGFLRVGFITDPMAAALASSGISGLLGVGVLALHCPIMSASHILVWHLGVIVVSIAGGAAVGYAASR